MGTARDYARLVRLPNVFTAPADILAGYWFVSAQLDFPISLLILAGGSMAMYAGGIVLNDLADREVDQLERPERPLPSGRVTIISAKVICITLLITGLLLALGAFGLRYGSDLSAGTLHGVVVAVAICICAVSYNLWLKNTVWGPVGMGSCRALNLLMGLCLAGSLYFDSSLVVVVATLIYVTSLSYFGRHETTGGGRGRLLTGSVGVSFSLLLLGVICAERIIQETMIFVLWLALCIHLVRVMMRAVKHPTADAVQYAMKTLILCVIPFDAVLAASSHGWLAGLCVLGLLVPALVASRWSYST